MVSFHRFHKFKMGFKKISKITNSIFSCINHDKPNCPLHDVVETLLLFLNVFHKSIFQKKNVEWSYRVFSGRFLQMIL